MKAGSLVVTVVGRGYCPTLFSLIAGSRHDGSYNCADPFRAVLEADFMEVFVSKKTV
jgi:hypothetical protein